jgi:hypothetical protein
LRLIFSHSEGKICASGPEPGKVEALLKKGKWLGNKPAKLDLVTRQEMPGKGWFQVPGFRFRVSGIPFIALWYCL